MPNRKLGKVGDQRRAMLRNLVTSFLWNGRLETTEARAKEVQSIAEKYIHMAILECENFEMIKKEVNNEKGQTVTIEVKNDLPSKLHARRQIMSYLYNITLPQEEDEKKADYKKRVREVKHPVVEKLFNEIAPRMKQRNEEKNSSGGYTRVIKKGPRRGDAAPMAIIELV